MAESGSAGGSGLNGNRKWLLAFCLAVKIALYGLGAVNYGFLSDELYFLDAGAHPALGYVDFPPLIAWLAAGVQFLSGGSLWALRLVPAIAGFGVTWFAVEICRAAGGRRLAQWVTAIIVLLAPGFVSIHAIFTMNVFDQLWWVMSIWLLLRYLDGDGSGYMLATGAVLGVGIMTKLSILALCAALPLGLLIWYPGLYRRGEFWAAVFLAVLIALPFAVWQVANGFPFLDFVAAYGGEPPQAMVLQDPAIGLFITMNPIFALVWVPGAVAALLSPQRRIRLLGTVAWICVALFVLAGVKFYFAVPVFVVFIVAGAMLWEKLLASRPALRVLLVAVLLSGVISVPTAAPVLPIRRVQALADFIRDGQQGFIGGEHAQIGLFFPHFAEMHGWTELVDLVTRVFDGFTPEERAATALFAAYYGQAGALNQLDTEDRLPPAHSGHMSYDLWNAGLDLQRVLFVGFERGDIEDMYTRVDELAELNCRYCMPREDGLRLLLAEGLRVSGDEVRERLRRYYFF
ncbi:MAG: ArnT family glycosyltransferase [Gammaproteobacteria bacterium]